MPLTPGSRIGPYEVTAKIGEGGMGEVYRATDSNLKRAVALKVLPESVAADADRLARFQREAQVLATLNHPHIAAIYGLERSGGTTALVMELVEGPTLADRLAQGKLPIDEVRTIARQIADALDAAHDQGIVHRDLKPANVKVRPDGTVKVLDFGLAKAMSGAGPDSRSGSGATPSIAPTLTTPAMTMAGMILGTAAYMAPEQAKGRPVDRRADVWAFGAVLYELLTGKRAFDGDDVSEVLASVLAREPEWTALDRTDAGLASCVRRCLQRDPKQRFGDMQSVRLALDGAFDPASVVSGGRAAVRPRFAWLPWALTGAATLALLVLAVAFSRRAEPDRPVIRTAITAPMNTAFDFDVTVGPAVLSPDGRMVAFSARSTTGRIQLWVRSLEAPEARALDGTDGASFPFWSPDSRSVGYYSAARGRLERVEVAGGAPVVIARAGFVRGASWAANGTIAFDASDGGARIMIASIAGGEPTVVVKKGSPRSPSFLPDGRHFLYLSRDDRQVRVASVDGATDEPVTEAASNAVYASGQLLFLREGTLLAQPFDPVRRALSGSPVAVARGVQMLLGDPRGVFSASDTGLLLYQDGADAAATNLVWFTRDGTRQSVIGEMGSARGVFLSPDNRAAVIGLADVEGNLNLWRVDTASGQRLRLTFEPPSGQVSFFSTWSPDGRYVAYGVRRAETLVVARTPAGGGPEERLVELPSASFGPFPPRVTAWTTDNSTIVFSGESRSGVRTLPLPGTVDGSASTSKPIATAPDSALNARLSPNGRWFTYQASIAGGTVQGVFVEPFPGGGRRHQVTERGTLPVWSADGRTLYYANDNILSVVDVTEADGALRFGPPRALMPVIVGRGYSYDVAKDGRILALVTTEQRAARPLTLVQNWISALGGGSSGR